MIQLTIISLIVLVIVCLIVLIVPKSEEAINTDHDHDINHDTILQKGGIGEDTRGN
jgi:hypothetical protein